MTFSPKPKRIEFSVSKFRVHHDPPPEASREPELGSKYRYPAETSSFSIAFRLGQLRAPNSSAEGYQLAFLRPSATGGEGLSMNS